MKDNEFEENKNENFGLTLFDPLELDKAKKDVEDYMKPWTTAAFSNTPLFIRYDRKTTLGIEEGKSKSPFKSVPGKMFDIIEKVIKHHANDVFGAYEGLDAKEEDISAAFAEKITDSLLGEMKHQLDDKIIGEYKYRITTQKKQKQESKTGADLFGVCTIDQGDSTINKYFLMQAKIASLRKDGSIYAKDSRILTQAKSMTDISPASFFVLYTESGFYVVSALNVLNLGKSEIDTNLVHCKPYEEFNNLLLECFTGDNRCELEDWRKYITDPHNNPIPDEESLLHIIVKKTEPQNTTK